MHRPVRENENRFEEGNLFIVASTSRLKRINLQIHTAAIFFHIPVIAAGLTFLFFTHLQIFGAFHFWFRDLLRELDKKYEVLLIIFFLVFLLFLVSEGLLFVSFFWTSFHSFSFSTLEIWPGEGFYVPDPCELTFANTLLLSNAAISLGNAFISLEISCSFFIFFSLGLQIQLFNVNLL